MSTETPERRFPAHDVSSPARLADARSAFATWLASVCPRSDRIDELLVVVSELGANAAEASPPSGPPATVEAWASAAEVRIEVVNRVDASPVDRVWDLEDPLRTGGRGLMIVSAFTDDVEVLAEGDTVRVRCVAGLRARGDDDDASRG